MNLLRIILIFFAIYFIRRFFQLYKFVKKQSEMIKQQQNQTESKNESIDAEYKVID